MKQKQLSTSRRFRFAAHSGADKYGYVISSANAEPLLDARQTLHQNAHTHVTLEHLFIKALAKPIRESRFLNGRFAWGRFYEFDTVDIASVVTREEGRDMSIIKHKNVPGTNIESLAEKAKDAAQKSKAGESGENARSIMFHALPIFILRYLSRRLTWLNEFWGVSIPPVMNEPYMTGSAVVSNVGIFETQNTRAFAHMPEAFGAGLFIALHDVEEQAVAEDGSVTTQKRLPFTVTVDHRVLDAHEGFELLSSLRDRLENPNRWLEFRD